MPHQDQFYSAWVPNTWDELKTLLEELGVKDVPDAKADKYERYEFLGELELGLKAFTIPGAQRYDHDTKELVDDLYVGVHIASWDGDDESDGVDPQKDAPHLLVAVGLTLTSRYSPSILDIGMPHGRNDFFKLDITHIDAINKAVSAVLKREVGLVCIPNFY